jgi:hypothetical protein
MNDAIEKEIMNATISTVAKEVTIVIQPKITSIDWDNDNTLDGTIHASFTFGDRIFNIEPKFNTYDLKQVLRTKEEDLLSVVLKEKSGCRSKTITFQPDATMNRLESVFSIDLTKFAENGFFELYKIKWIEIANKQKEQLLVGAKKEWEKNTLVNNLDMIKSYGGQLEYESFEKYQEAVLHSWNILKIAAIFNKDVEGTNLSLHINKYEPYHSYSKTQGKDLYTVYYIGEQSRPMSFLNALKRVKEKIWAETTKYVSLNLFNKNHKTSMEIITNKLNEAGIKFTEYSKTQLTIYNDYITMQISFDVDSCKCSFIGFGGKYFGYGSSSHPINWTIDEVVSIFNDFSLKVSSKVTGQVEQK